MASIRGSVGICPQHSVLWDNLSVTEHLELYAEIKNVPKQEALEQIEEHIQLVGLTEKRHVHSMALSGGMKRKLSVAIALLGKSKTVFLDEPTSGMDPYSRRATWELLRRSTAGRAIILTTHFMDEADLLGDRIAVMGSGTLLCCGSSLFLKSHYGIGYNLTLTAGNRLQLSCELVTATVLRHVSGAKILSQASGEMAFQLPLESVSYFGNLFEEIDKHLTDYGVGGYGISITTLEEVFIRIAQGEVDKKTALDAAEQALIDVTNANASQDGIELEEIEGAGPHVSEEEEGGLRISSGVPQADILPGDWVGSISPIYMQFYVMLVKKFIVSHREKQKFLLELGLPVVVVILVLLMLSLTFSPAGPSMLLSPVSLYTSPTDAPLSRENTQMRSSLEQPGLYLVNRSQDTQYEMSEWLLDSYFEHAPHTRWGAYAFNTSVNYTNEQGSASSSERHHNYNILTLTLTVTLIGGSTTSRTQVVGALLLLFSIIVPAHTAYLPSRPIIP